MFRSPAFELGPFDRAQIVELVTWAATIGLVIFFTDLARLILDRLSKRESELSLVTRELEHRNKNTLATIESIVRRTLRNHPEQALTLVGRVRSITFANNLTARSGDIDTQLRSLLTFELDPYDKDRVHLSGPEVWLPPDTVRTLVLIIHELATNAAKYGSLAEVDGHLDVSWRWQGKQIGTRLVGARRPARASSHKRRLRKPVDRPVCKITRRNIRRHV